MSDWYDRVPKVELHLHLEGAIPLEALWRLCQKYGGNPLVPTPAALERRFVYRDFAHFIDTWVWKNRFLREPEDFTLVAEAVARDLQAQNVRYAEAFYSPPDFAHAGLTPQVLTEAIRAGLDRVPGVRVALVANLVRDFGPERGANTLAAVAEVRDLGVVGIGIGGSEQHHPPEPWAGVFARARSLGFRTSAHAGEAAGAASVWGAVRALAVDRIGHGTRAHEDPALLDHLAATQLPLETCPGSNVCTGVVARLAEHPIASYITRGLCVTVSTDDPKMFGTSLAGEYRALSDTFGLGRDDVRRLILTAARVSWLDAGGRAALCRELVADPEW